MATAILEDPPVAMVVGYRLTAMPASFVSCTNSQDTGLAFSCAHSSGC